MAIRQRKKASDREEQILDRSIGVLQQHLNPERIMLFGSRAKGSFRYNSDFDLALDCTSPDLGVRSAIRDALDDVSGLYGVDVVYLRDVDPRLRDIILATGTVVYEKRT